MRHILAEAVIVGRQWLKIIDDDDNHDDDVEDYVVVFIAYGSTVTIESPVII